MPHASGGGSSGGGCSSSSGGSYHHSHGRSGPRFSGRYFPGSRHYIYYDRGYRRDFYSDTEPCKKNPILMILPLIVILITGLLFTSYFFSSMGIPSKLPETKAISTGSFCEDNAGIIDDKNHLEDSLQKFYNKTGIIPYFITMHNKDLPNTYGPISYDSLEQYAYNLYVNHFEDEGHFLIVYSESDDGSDWYWAGMQGDDTDNIISENHFNKFQQDMQKYLNKTNYSVDSAVVKAVDNSIDYMLKMNLDTIRSNAFVIIFLLFFIGIPLWGIFQGIANQKKQNAYCDYMESQKEAGQAQPTSDENKTNPGSYNLNGEYYCEKRPNKL